MDLLAYKDLLFIVFSLKKKSFSGLITFRSVTLILTWFIWVCTCYLHWIITMKNYNFTEMPG